MAQEKAQAMNLSSLPKWPEPINWSDAGSGEGIYNGVQMEADEALDHYDNDLIAALRARLALAVEHIASSKLSHNECEDPWYSCPLSAEGCVDERQSGCTCGADRFNAEADAR